MRLFVAIPLPGDIRSDVGRWAKALAREVPDPHHRLHWVREEQYHLTLKFLGETPEGKIPGLSHALKGAAGHVASFPLQLSKVGHFGGRVVWLGIETGDDHAMMLAKDVEKSCISAGFKGESRSFSPHITLARSKTSPGPLRLVLLPPSLTQKTFGPYPADEFCLIQSTLTPRGAIYRTLERFPLK